jgi:tRNA uridine 5-carbamoylmethylation protein Kti12
MSSEVLILTGPPGSGKTTAARLLACRFEMAVHLEADRFFEFIAAGLIAPWRLESHEQNEVVIRIVAKAAAGYAEAGYFTIVDGILLPRWFFEPLRNALHDAGHPVSYAVLRATLEVCMARAAERDEQPMGDPKVVERLWHDFADLGDLEHHAVDAEAGPEEAAALIAELLEDGSLRA